MAELLSVISVSADSGVRVYVPGCVSQGGWERARAWESSSYMLVLLFVCVRACRQ